MRFRIDFEIPRFLLRKVKDMKPLSKALLTVAVILVIAAAAVGALMVFNKSPDLLDSDFCIIVTGSMDGEPHPEYEIETIPIHSLIAVHKLQGDEVNDVKVGDVIGFYSAKLHGNIYHRVIAINEVDRVFTTKGDAATTTEAVSFDKAVGVVANVSEPAGVFITFVKTNIFLLVAMVVILLVMSEAVIYLMKTWKE